MADQPFRDSEATSDDEGRELPADSMLQGYVDFETLGAANADHSPESVLGVLIETERALRRVRTEILEEMRGDRRSGEILRIVGETLPVAMRAAAPSLIEITDTLISALDADARSHTRSDGSKAAPATIGPRALAVLPSWLSVADSTRIVAIAGFELSLQLGRAPNGKPISA